MITPHYYAITHLTLYQYSEPVNDSVMELRMRPRSEGWQRCARFSLDISPTAHVDNYRDYVGNIIHTFDIPAPHRQLAIKAEAVVELHERRLPLAPLPQDAWDQLDGQIQNDPELFDMLLPGKYTKQTDLLAAFAREINWGRTNDPLTLLRDLNAAIYEHFEYKQNVTEVDSPIDIALETRRGVCQDFTHIMITMARAIGIPCRYVSGYLFHQSEGHYRSDEAATHAWVEAWLPGLEWVGFDPTNDTIANERHIRVSIGNDYAEATPSKGVFKGTAETELSVRVQVEQLESLPMDETVLAPNIVMPHYQLDNSSPPLEQQAQQQ
jgi:transglutaminase-like putative cysteine protease